MARRKIAWQVTEDGGGGLVLWVWRGDRMIFAHSGYEYRPGGLREDVAALNDGSDPREWDGNEIDLLREEYSSYILGVRVIADEHGPVDVDRMGAAGRAEFYPGEAA